MSNRTDHWVSNIYLCSVILINDRVKRIFLHVWLLLIFAQGYGQSNTIQAIETKHAKETEMFRLVNESNSLLMDSNISAALTKVKQALEISYDIDNDRGEAFSYYTLGTIHYKKSNYEEAIRYFLKGTVLFKKLGDLSANYKTIRYLGQSYEAAKDYDKAIRYYTTYLSLAQKQSNTPDELFAKNGLGRTYFNAKNYTKSNSYFQQLLVAYRSVDDDVKVSEMYDHIGKGYAGLKDTINALKYFGLAGTLGDTYSSDLAQRNSWQNVGRSYNSIGDYDNSIEYEKKAKTVNKNRKDYKAVQQNNNNIANDYIFMNRADEAIPFLNENINLSSGSGEVRSTGETYKALSEAYVQLGQLEEAKRSFDQYVIVQEQLLAEKENELNKKANVSNTYNDKERQIELLIRDKELDKERIGLLESKQQLEADRSSAQKRINYLLGGLLLLLLVGLAFFYRSYRQKQLANKLLSIRSLRSQMNPHFIFNSLNSVNSFISKSDEKSANKYLSEFARLMRTVLEHSKEDFVVLSAEIEVLQRYLNLEHIRFHDQFDYTFKVDDDLEVDRIMLPPMLVQPYVENAIWHGLRYKEGKGTLVVHFSSQDGGLRITVKDDGIGRTQSRQIKTKNQKQGKSTGLKNTASRVKLLNDVHNIKITSEISDISANGSGTLVEIKMPFIDVDDKKLIEID
ncbi:MAG: two-component system LytT family sensor kinase [Bacteroidia bacterium]